MIGRILGAIPMVGVWVCFAAAPAHAESELSLSIDGITWTDAIHAPLFPAATWVPGDDETAAFFIRNSGGTVGDLTIDVTSSGDTNLVNQLRLSAQGGGGTWQSVSALGTQRVLTAPSIPDGHVEQIVLTVAFNPGSTSATQLQSAGLEWLVTLTERVPPVPEDPSADPSAGGSELPDTGASAQRWMLALAAAAIGAGMASLSRREREEVA